LAYAFLTVVLHTLLGIAAAAVLVFGFVYLIFLGDAEARGRPLVSRGFDRLAALVVYASWFAPLWWFGVSRPLLMVACAAAVAFCIVYVASYRATLSRTPPDPLVP
jgi:hypothetical protein